MFNNFGTIRTRPSSAHLFEDSSDPEESPSVKERPTPEAPVVIDSRRNPTSIRLSTVFKTQTSLESTFQFNKISDEKAGSISPQIDSMTEKSRIRMPKLNLSLFDGDGQSADRWLALLKQDFSAENVYKETHPQLWLEAIYSKVSGKAED